MKLNNLKVLVAVSAALLFAGVSAFASEIDSRIEKSARDSYVFKSYLKNDNVKVKSDNGVVTLTGTVAEESHKLMAKETVESLPGVKSVDNKLESKEPTPAENSDEWIKIKIKTSLLFKRNVSGINTEVIVKDGIVTLKGEVDSQAQKDLAGEYVKDIDGVKEVNNEMTIASVPVKPKQTMGEKIDDASITAQVKIALLWHRSTSALKTGVVTNNGVVTISGTTSNEAGKDMVAKVASDVNGVTEVVNNMTIEEPMK